MRGTGRLVTGLMLAGCAAGSAGADRDGFDGVWNFDPAACGAQPSETRLEIHGASWRFYESACLMGATAPGPDAVSTVLECEGEGESWQRTVALRRMGDRLELAEDGELLVYHLCAG